MNEAHAKIAKILRIQPQIIEDLVTKMNALTGKKDVIEKLMEENDILIHRTLQELGISGDGHSAENVYGLLMKRLTHIDQQLYEALDRPDLSQLSHMCGKLCEVALSVNGTPRGFFLKREKAIKLLEKYPPTNLLEHFKHSTVNELIDQQGFTSVFSALRFTQSQEWMHTFFDEVYDEIRPEDFEEREVELKVLEKEWLAVAEKFLKKKHHNVSHLKELGIIFIVPLTLDTPGETLRMFTLILHYLNEVPFYSKLFRRFAQGPDFTVKLKSLLRGDVSSEQLPARPAGGQASSSKLRIRIVQRYLAKDDENDFRLLEPHVNPEAEHWHRAEGDLGRIGPLVGSEGFSLGFWHGLDYVGDFFKEAGGSERFISFDLIDLIMSVVEKKNMLYHQQEAMWNKIFSEYLGREKLEKMIEENIIEGFITL